MFPVFASYLVVISRLSVILQYDNVLFLLCVVSNHDCIISDTVLQALLLLLQLCSGAAYQKKKFLI